jgi:hypothetical protein
MCASEGVGIVAGRRNLLRKLSTQGVDFLNLDDYSADAVVALSLDSSPARERRYCFMHRNGWTLRPRLGTPIRVKRWTDLAPGETFQESHSALAAVELMNALSHDELTAREIYLDFCRQSLHRSFDHGSRLDNHELDMLRGAFRHGQYVIVPLRPAPRMAWGAKVSAKFRKKVIEICGRLGTKPDYLMACMAFESGETFSASVRNPLSGAVGLIQFTRDVATGLGTSIDALAAMTPEDQLDYVERYFLSKGCVGQVATLEDLYMAILWPKAIGSETTSVLFSDPSKYYVQNRGLDANKDHAVTKFEAASQVRAKLVKGAQYSG